MRGEAPMTWDLWSSDIGNSSVLTSSGKAAVQAAVSTTAEFLGPNWLAKFLPTEGAVRHLPLMSVYWWPSNDVPHVHMRLLDLGARLTLLKDCAGADTVRRDMRKDLGHFAHGLLQMEVGGLALRDGWKVEFEPATNGARRTDVRVSRGCEAIMVEVKGFLLEKQAPST